MKYLYLLLIAMAGILLSGCGEVIPPKAPKPLQVFHVKDNMKLTKKTVNTIEYKAKIEDVQHLGWGDTWETIHDDMEFTGSFEDSQGLILATFDVDCLTIKDNHHKIEWIIPSLEMIMVEMHNRGIKYFQILGPYSISNDLGFPINTIEGMYMYMIPEYSNPEEDDDELPYDKKLHSIFLNIFRNDMHLKLTIRPVKDPKPNQIVWDVEKNLH